MKKMFLMAALLMVSMASVNAQEEEKVDKTPKIGGTIRSKYEYQTEEGGQIRGAHGSCQRIGQGDLGSELQG